MLGDAVPRVVREALGELHLRRRVEGLPRQAQRRDRHAGRQLFGPEHAVVLDRHQVRIGLPLQADIELDIPCGERRHHRVPQIVVGRAQREARDRRPLLRFRPDRVLHRLPFAEQIGHAAEVRRLERTALRLDPQRLHDEIEHVRPMEVDEVENLRVLQALDLQLRVGLGVRRHEGRRRDAEHVLRELFLVHQLRPGHAHQLDADAHEARHPRCRA